MKPEFCELPGLNSAYEAGKLAREADKSVDDNPYPKDDTLLYAVWLLGYCDED